MAARLLRRNSVFPANNSWTDLTGAIPAARAFVGRVIVAPISTGTTFSIAVCASSPTSQLDVVASNIVMSGGENFTETVVVPAGQRVWVAAATASTASFTAMGEEVDN